MGPGWAGGRALDLDLDLPSSYFWNVPVWTPILGLLIFKKDPSLIIWNML